MNIRPHRHHFKSREIVSKCRPRNVENPRLTIPKGPFRENSPSALKKSRNCFQILSEECGESVAYHSKSLFPWKCGLPFQKPFPWKFALSTQKAEKLFPNIVRGMWRICGIKFIEKEGCNSKSLPPEAFLKQNPNLNVDENNLYIIYILLFDTKELQNLDLNVNWNNLTLKGLASFKSKERNLVKIAKSLSGISSLALLGYFSSWYNGRNQLNWPRRPEHCFGASSRNPKNSRLILTFAVLFFSSLTCVCVCVAWHSQQLTNPILVPLIF